MLRIGDSLQKFTTVNQNDVTVSTSDLIGYWVVLYFYPKDDTPGCTLESCNFRDANDTLKSLGCKVFGISKDSVASHRNFINKHNLPFDLLSDYTGEICQNFGVWMQKSMFGKKYFGIQRTTFLINPDGKIVHVWKKVSVTNHVHDVIKVLQAQLV